METQLKTGRKDVGKRLAVIKKENKWSYEAFLAEINDNPFGITMSLSSLHGMTTGDREISTSLIILVCFKLGYAPYWLLTGRGEKKGSAPSKIITDIQLFRVELDVERSKRQILESQVDLLFKILEDLKK